MCQKWEGDCGLWVLNKIIRKMYPAILKKMVGMPYWSYLLNSTANLAQFEWKWAGLAFNHIFSIHFFNYSIKNPQTTNDPTFVKHNISAIGGVSSTILEIHKSLALINEKIILHCRLLWKRN